MKTINLLPQSKQQEFYYHRLLGSFVRLFWIAGSSFVLVLLAQFGTRVYLEHEITIVQEKAEQVKRASNKDDNAKLKKQIQLINSEIVDYTNVAKEAPRWSNVIIAFSKLVPDKVYIQNFVVDSAKRQVSINGFAPDRESVIALYNNIAGATEQFSGIDYPLENVSKPTDVQFKFTFTVEEKLLK